MLKRIDVHLRNVPDLVSTCLVLYNLCIIFGDEFWKIEWTQEATDEVHNGLSANMVPGIATRERIAVANHALHNLAGIHDSSRETLEYMLQETAKEFQFAMGTAGKTSKELYARRNGITKSIWQAKIKASIAETFTQDNVRKHMYLEPIYQLLHNLLHTHQYIHLHLIIGSQALHKCPARLSDLTKAPLHECFVLALSHT